MWAAGGAHARVGAALAARKFVESSDMAFLQVCRVGLVGLPAVGTMPRTPQHPIRPEQPSGRPARARQGPSNKHHQKRPSDRGHQIGKRGHIRPGPPSRSHQAGGFTTIGAAAKLAAAHALCGSIFCPSGYERDAVFLRDVDELAVVDQRKRLTRLVQQDVARVRVGVEGAHLYRRVHRG